MTDEEIIEAFKKKHKEDIKKAVIRPKFGLYKELLQIVVFLSPIVLIAVFGGVLKLWQYLTLLTVAILIFVIVQTKNIILLMIFLYQKFAPKTIRAACLFQPSCSEYMKQSIIKYGVFKG